MADYTWNDRELVILEAVRQAEEDGTLIEAAANDCLPDLDSRRHTDALISLIDGGFLEGNTYREGGGHVSVQVQTLTATGRREIGQWPKTDPAEALMQLMDARIATAPEGEAKSKLTRARDALAGLGRETLKSVAVALASKAATGF